MDLVDLEARSTFLANLEFTELECSAEKNMRRAVFLDLELRRALPNTLYNLQRE